MRMKINERGENKLPSMLHPKVFDMIELLVFEIQAAHISHFHNLLSLLRSKIY